MSLLSSAFQSRLMSLELALRRALPSTSRGDRRSPLKKGVSLEFADFRNYVEGDDVRHMDWASYARLDQLVVKLYHDEEDVQLHVLVDASRSMGYGEGTKARFARELAAAFCWIGLTSQCRVTLTCLNDAPRPSPLARGGAALGPLLETLEREPNEGSRPLSETCAEAMHRLRPRGVIVLVSDLMDPLGPRATLDALQRPVTEVSIVQVLHPDELSPSFDGDLLLKDLETEQGVEVSLTPAVLAAYERTAKAFVAECADVSRRRGAAFSWTKTDANMEDFVLRTLVQEGLVR
jgi:uncharacterized protein (DUF58 family)